MALTCDQAAQILKIAPQTVRRHVLRGHIKAHRFGNAWVIEPEALTEFALRDRRPYWFIRAQEKTVAALDSDAQTR